MISITDCDKKRRENSGSALPVASSSWPARGFRRFDGSVHFDSDRSGQTAWRKKTSCNRMHFRPVRNERGTGDDGGESCFASYRGSVCGHLPISDIATPNSQCANRDYYLQLHKHKREAQWASADRLGWKSLRHSSAVVLSPAVTERFSSWSIPPGPTPRGFCMTSELRVMDWVRLVC